MDKYLAVKTINEFFSYKSDSEQYKFFEVWNVMDLSQDRWVGDCEDYALTVLWLMSDENVFKFAFNLLINPKYSIWMVKVKSSGEGHAILRHDDLYVDNISKSWFAKDTVSYREYKWLFPIIPPVIIVKYVMSLPFILLKKFKYE